MTTPALLDLRREARANLPVITAPGDLGRAAIPTWRARMVNEFTSSTVFEKLADQMLRADWDVRAVDECRGFADEERKHGALCGAVVEALGGEAVAVAPSARTFPTHAEVAPIEGVLRNLLSVGCLSETVAVALIGAERLEMPEGPLEQLLTEIYADEVGHARFGWRQVSRALPTVDDVTRERLGRYLAVAFAHLEAHELAHLPTDRLPPPGGESLGLCSGADGRRLFYEVVETVIVPGLTQLGLDAAAAWNCRNAEGGATKP